MARPVVIGRVVGLFGVAGWVKVESYTEPRANILQYRPWRVALEGRETRVDAPRGRDQGKGFVVHWDGLVDRDAAAAWIGAEISVPREALPAAAQGEVYWADLEGLSVRTVEGVELGTVSHLFSTGANDVLVVRGTRERLIPYLRPDVVREVDLAAGVVVVDWDPDF